MHMPIVLIADPGKRAATNRELALKFKDGDPSDLLDLATNPRRSVDTFQERVIAMEALKGVLQRLSIQTNRDDILTDYEIEKLYDFIKDENFPVLVSPDEFTVQSVTNEPDHEDPAYKNKVLHDIEQNVARLKGDAALLIVDYGLNTRKFKQLRQPLVRTITDILDDMLAEKDHLFVTVTLKPTSYFTNFIEALYCIDERAAEVFMERFGVTTNDFNPHRIARIKGASQIITCTFPTNLGQ